MLIAKIAEVWDALAMHVQPDCPFEPPHSTMSVNTVRGGVQLNMLAADCEFGWDMRVLPDISPQDTYGQIADGIRAIDPN